MDGTWYNGGVKLLVEATTKYFVWNVYLCCVMLLLLLLCCSFIFPCSLVTDDVIKFGWLLSLCSFVRNLSSFVRTFDMTD